MNDLDDKTVLVTGAAGFIGSNLMKRLAMNKNINLIVLARQSFDIKDQGNITTVAASLDKLTIEIWRQAGISNIDIVFHLAAYTPKSWDNANDVNEIQRDNIVGTQTLLESLPGAPRRIIFASTLDVYDSSFASNVIDESCPINPAALYGASKYYGEHLIRAHAKKMGCGCAVLRYGHIFGPGEAAYNKLVPKTVKDVLEGRDPVVFGTGSAERDLLYVDDAVEATIRAASSPLQEIGPVNIVRGKSMPIRQIVELIIRLSGSNRKIHYLPEKADGYSLRFDNRMMRDLLGTWPLVSYEEGLTREVQEVQKGMQRMHDHG